MAERLMKLDKKDIAYLTKLEGITEEQSVDFYLKNQAGTYFIKRSGLLYLMEKKYGANSFSIITEVPDEREISSIRKMLCMGEKESKPFVVMKSTVRVKESLLEFTDYGSASMGNTNNSTKQYLIEMASTRSSNRALRMATSCGFTSDSELSIENEIADSYTPPVETEKSRKGASKPKEIEVKKGSELSDRENKIKSIHSIKDDFGYSETQLQATLKKLFGKETLEDLSDEELGIVYDKMLKLKVA